MMICFYFYFYWRTFVWKYWSVLWCIEITRLRKKKLPKGKQISSLKNVFKSDKARQTGFYLTRSVGVKKSSKVKGQRVEELRRR